VGISIGFSGLSRSNTVKPDIYKQDFHFINSQKNELTYFSGIGFVRRLITMVTMPEMKKSTIEK
jgi:hypothetical protein